MLFLYFFVFFLFSLIAGLEETGSTELAQNFGTSSVSVKPPQFYRNNPEGWFRQLESQFHLAGITKSVTKYHYVIAALPEDIACDPLVDDIGQTAQEDLIKSRLISAVLATVRTALVGHDDVSLEQFAKIADSIVSVVSNESLFIAHSYEEKQQWPNRQNH